MPCFVTINTATDVKMSHYSSQGFVILIWLEMSQHLVKNITFVATNMTEPGNQVEQFEYRSYQAGLQLKMQYKL